MKTLSMIECRSCGTYIHDSDNKVVLQPYEQIFWSIRKIPKCSECKRANDRTTTAKKRRVRPEDYR